MGHTFSHCSTQPHPILAEETAEVDPHEKKQRRGECTSMYIHTHTRTHAYIHTRTHTYTHTDVRWEISMSPIFYTVSISSSPPPPHPLPSLLFPLFPLLSSYKYRTRYGRILLWSRTIPSGIQTLAHPLRKTGIIKIIIKSGNCTSIYRVWPAVVFFAIVFGVPWLLWKLLSAAGGLY